MEKKELTPKQMWDNINSAIKEYEADVLAMSDDELYDHVYNDDYNEDDFASKELKKRGIEKCDCNGAKQIIGCSAKSCCYWETNLIE